MIGESRRAPGDGELLELLSAIASRDRAAATRLVARSQGLARQAVTAGATRAGPASSFFDAVAHYAYAGDTPLHFAAAAYQRAIAADLVARGADVRARNRRGAEPLHYAADGSPGSGCWDPEAQQAVIRFLVGAGADPNALDKSGVAPLHRAVRTRCAGAVAALLDGGADPRLRNGNGSTPLHLAVRNTGRGSSGSPEARAQQEAIIRLLLRRGARPADRDAAGRTARASATAAWIQALLQAR